METFDIGMIALRFAVGMALGVLCGLPLATWMSSPGRCAVCHKRIPAKPEDWLCSFKGPSSDTAAVLYYHAACSSQLSREQLDTQIDAEWERIRPRASCQPL